MFIIDTNILAAELLEEHEQDALTASFLAFYTELPLIKRVIPDFILNEFETLMIQVVPSRYRLTSDEKKNLKNNTSAYIQKIIEKHTLITPSTATLKEAFTIYQQNINTHYISFTDSLMLALAQQHNFTILSKDERLITRAKELRIPYYEPQTS